MADLPEDWRNGGFGLYIHWPFCQSKCPYCDFNSHVSASIDQKAWLNAYLSELDRNAERTPDRVLKSVFFGGGTPSLMEPDVVAAILERVGQLWTPANDQEITLEANPTSVEAGRFRAYADAGVNRVSMGLQSLRAEDLRRLGRLHSVEEGRRAFEIAKDCFKRVSFDLIYARQDQTLSDWKDELREALSLAGDHLSLYQLTIEAGTAFGDRFERGLLRGLPHDDDAADMYEVTREICAEFGLYDYEVSNYARPGAESRHNLIYWHYGDYVGVGPGAHGRVTINDQRHASDTFKQPGKWLEAVNQGTGEKLFDPISPTEQANEYLMMCLRLTQGVDMARFEALGGKPLDPATLKDLEQMGMITVESPYVKATHQGRLVLNAVIAELLLD